MEKNNIPREQSEEEARREFEKHIESAGIDRSEAERLKSLWNEIGSLPEEEPDENLRRRFDAMVAAYKAGMSHPETECAKRRPRVYSLFGRFANHPVLSAAAVLLLFLIGGYAGYSLKNPGIPVVAKPESINKMRADVRQMDQVVMLSLMEQSQVTSRLKGVMYAYRIDNPDNSVLEALLHAVKNDPNTNVRLAAVDALYRYGSPRLRQEPACRNTRTAGFPDGPDRPHRPDNDGQGEERRRDIRENARIPESQQHRPQPARVRDQAAEAGLVTENFVMKGDIS